MAARERFEEYLSRGYSIPLSAKLALNQNRGAISLSFIEYLSEGTCRLWGRRVHVKPEWRNGHVPLCYSGAGCGPTIDDEGQVLTNDEGETLYTITDEANTPLSEPLTIEDVGVKFAEIVRGLDQPEPAAV